MSPKHFPRQRLRLWRRLGGILGGPYLRNLPRGIINDSRATLAETEHVARVEVLGPASAGACPSFVDRFPASRAYPERIAITLNDVIADPRTGLLQLPDGRILQESIGGLDRVLGWGRVLPPAKPSDIRTADGATIIFAPPLSYYHWVTEVLPAISYAIEQSDDDFEIIAFHESPSYVSLTLLQIADAAGGRISISLSDGAIRCARVLFLPRMNDSRMVHPVDVRLIRSLPIASQRSHPSSGRSIYVARFEANRRPFRGERRLADLFAEQGFEVVLLEQLSPTEQVDLFREAKIVVGLHGAGLVNAIWSSPGTVLFELFSSTPHNDCYRNIAAVADLVYRWAPLDGVALDSVVETVMACCPPVSKQ